jgi:hypothetical protein
VPEGVVDQGAHRRHCSDIIVYPLEHGANVLIELTISVRLRDAAQVECLFSHGLS